MKKALLFSALGLLSVLAIAAYAQGPGMMGGYGYGMGHGMMGGYGGYGMGPGMMGGYGGGPGGGYCPNCGAYVGPQGGYGRGPGMMGPGWGGPGYGRGGVNQSEECQKFLSDTASMRKELYNKRYEYFEAMRNPKTTPDQAAKMEKELWEMQQKIYSKAPQACW